MGYSSGKKDNQKQVLMNAPANWIHRHQVVAFFILSFAITWGLGFSYFAFYRGAFLLMPLGFVATCGPALAGILVTAITNTQPRQGSKKSTWIAFLLALVVIAPVWLAHTRYFDQVTVPPILLGLILVSLAPVAFVFSMTYSRIPAVKCYLSSLVRLRGVWGWSLLALVLYPALMLLTNLVCHLLNQPPCASWYLPQRGLALIGLVAVKFLYQFFFFNASGEEVGWRGFALPRLQERTSPLVASLIIALFWIPWHFFLWASQGVGVTEWDFWISNSPLIMLSSIILTWFYNRSQGSILVAGILHAAENSTARLLLLQDMDMYFMTKAALALALILVDRMWQKLPADHPAVFHVFRPANDALAANNPSS